MRVRKATRLRKTVGKARFCFVNNEDIREGYKLQIINDWNKRKHEWECHVTRTNFSRID